MLPTQKQHVQLLPAALSSVKRSSVTEHFASFHDPHLQLQMGYQPCL